MRKTFSLTLLLLFFGFTATAQETAMSLAKTLQEQFLASPAVSFSFDIEGRGHIKILADLKNGRMRMEGDKNLIVTDFKTVWNYDKPAHTETIDQAYKDAIQDASTLFRFADNYSSRIIHQHGPSKFTLELTPKGSLQSLLSNAGNMGTLTLQLQKKKSTVKIVSASAISTEHSLKIEHIQISALKSVPNDKQFEIVVPSSTKVIDLRE